MSIKAMKRDCVMYFEYNSSCTDILIIKTNFFLVSEPQTKNFNANPIEKKQLPAGRKTPVTLLIDSKNSKIPFPSTAAIGIKSALGHDCHPTKGKEINEKRKRPVKELLKETKTNSKYIRDQGYKVVEMLECDWRRLKKTSSQVPQFLNTKFRRPLDRHKTLTETQNLTAIRSESLFGVVECDIRVPDSLKPAFAEMPPVLKNTNISSGLHWRIHEIICRSR